MTPENALHPPTPETRLLPGAKPRYMGVALISNIIDYTFIMILWDKYIAGEFQFSIHWTGNGNIVVKPYKFWNMKS